MTVEPATLQLGTNQVRCRWVRRIWSGPNAYTEDCVQRVSCLDVAGLMGGKEQRNMLYSNAISE